MTRMVLYKKVHVAHAIALFDRYQSYLVCEDPALLHLPSIAYCGNNLSWSRQRRRRQRKLTSRCVKFLFTEYHNEFMANHGTLHSRYIQKVKLKVGQTVQKTLPPLKHKSKLYILFNSAVEHKLILYF